jgi:hypothetical protein
MGFSRPYILSPNFAKINVIIDSKLAINIPIGAKPIIVTSIGLAL